MYFCQKSPGVNVNRERRIAGSLPKQRLKLVSRAPTEIFPTLFVAVRISPTTAVQRVNGLFIFLKLYLFCFFLLWNMGDQTKVLRRRKKKEVSKFSFPCCVFLAGYFPLEPTFYGPWLISWCRCKVNVRLLFFGFVKPHDGIFSIYRIFLTWIEWM